jgi:hypothetical protein
MKNLTQTQQCAVDLLRSKLDPQHDLFAGSREVEKALTGEARAYFTTWVLPLLDYLSAGEQWRGQAEEIKREYRNRFAASQARKKAAKSGIL